MNNATTALKPLFSPRGIAVIGASDKPDKLGSIMMKSLEDFPGKVIGINPRGSQGMYTSVAEAVKAEGPIDLVISCIPAAVTAAALREASEAGAGAALICSGGFAEAQGDGYQYQEDLQKVVDETGLRVLGPNTSGFYLPGEDFLACFVPGVKYLQDGNISVISSSGGVNLATCFNLHRAGRGVRLGLGIGGAMNITAAELVEYLTEDDKTEVIALHIEKVEDGPRLMQAVREASKRKPVVTLVIGRTDIKEFARRHTGSLDTSWHLTRAALTQSGAVVVDTEQELVESAIALSGRRIPPKEDPKVSFVTGQAGPGMIIADRLQTDGIPLPNLASHAYEKVTSLLPPLTHMKDIVDTGRPSPNIDEVIAAVGLDDNIDAIGTFAIVEETLNLTSKIVDSGVDDRPTLAGIDGPIPTVADAAATSVEQGIPLVLGPTAVAVGLRALVHDSRAQFGLRLPIVEPGALPERGEAGTGVRLRLSAYRDEIFETVVSLGFGREGISDQAVRVAPVTQGMAAGLVDELAGKHLLLEQDGDLRFDATQVEQILSTLVAKLEDNPEASSISVELEIGEGARMATIAESIV